MPHIIVKLYPGRSEQQKIRFTEEIVKNVIDTLGSNEKSVSVAFEEIPAEDWNRKVYEPDIQSNWNKLTKKPGYQP